VTNLVIRAVWYSNPATWMNLLKKHHPLAILVGAWSVTIDYDHRLCNNKNQVYRYFLIFLATACSYYPCQPCSFPQVHATKPDNPCNTILCSFVYPNYALKTTERRNNASDLSMSSSVVDILHKRLHLTKLSPLLACTSSVVIVVLLTALIILVQPFSS